MKKFMSIRWLQQLSCLLLIMSMFAAFKPALAQNDDDEPNFNSEQFVSKVVSIKGSIVECEGGFVADLSDADIRTFFTTHTINELEVGMPIQVEGKVLADQSSSTRTFFKADNVIALGLRNEINVSAFIQQTDETRKTITILNHEVTIDDNTKLLRKTKKKLKPTTLEKMEIGSAVTVDAQITPNGLVARRIVNGLAPINGAQFTGFVKAYENNIIEFAGGFKFDVSFLGSTTLPGFPFPKVDTMVTVGNFANLKENVDPIKSFAYSSSDPANAPFSFLDLHLQDINLANQTITTFGRTITVKADAEIYVGSKRATLGELKVGSRTGIGFVVTENGLLVDAITQF